MKTVLRFFFAACLLVALSSSALAAGLGMSYYGDFVPDIMLRVYMIAPGEHLFSTGERGPQLSLQGFYGVDGPDTTLAGAEYYRNDLVYAELVSLNGADLILFSGGYLWEEPGIFAAFDHLDAGDGVYIVSGGYRFDVGGGSYAALSLDYSGGDLGENLAGQAIVKYHADGLKLSGQLWVGEHGDYMIHGKANLAAGENLVWGGGLTWFGSDFYMVFAGLTWTGDSCVFDGLVDVDDEGDVIYYLSYLHSFSDALAVGLNYMDDEMGDAWVALKGRYQLGRGVLTLSYATTAGGGEWALIGLGYEKSL